VLKSKLFKFFPNVQTNLRGNTIVNKMSWAIESVEKSYLKLPLNFQQKHPNIILSPYCSQSNYIHSYNLICYLVQT